MGMLELGAGAGPIGIAMALDGAESMVTDLSGLVPLLRLNVARNGFGTYDTSDPGTREASFNASKSRRSKTAEKRRQKAAKRDADSDDNVDRGTSLDGASSQKVSSAKERRQRRAA